MSSNEKTKTMKMGEDELIKDNQGYEQSARRSKISRVNVREAKASPTQMRPALSENYAGPVSERELWWRCTIKETPNPGSYQIPDNFMGDLSKRPNTYSFKSDGRRLDPMPQIGHGQYLMPGAYNHKSIVEDLNNRLVTYTFKNTGRAKGDTLNFGKKDKDINIPPNEYETQKYLSLTTEKHPIRYWQFKSESSRFPTTQFVPKLGPGPGEYEYSSRHGEKHAISSSFKSKTPRFMTSHTKTPGPGAYEKTYQSPMPKTIMKMGRQHGLYFTSAY